MKVFLLLHFGIISSSLFAPIGSAASDIPPRDLQTYHDHAIRASSAEFSNTTDVYRTPAPSAAPSIPLTVQLSSAAVPSAPPSEILNPSDISAATESDSSTIPPDNSQQEEQSGIAGMNLFQACAAVIFVATIVGLFGHFGMKLLPNRLREDNSQDDIQLEDSLATRSQPNRFRKDNSRNEFQLEDSLASFRSDPRFFVTSLDV